MAPVVVDQAHLPSRYASTGERRFGFQLKNTIGFEPPAAISALRDSVNINLASACHYFYTCVERDEPAFTLVDEFNRLSIRSRESHAFRNCALSRDNEIANARSSSFAKLIGIGFMARYARSTWFCPVNRVEPPLTVGDSVIARVGRKRPGDGPDYLSSEFDPTRAPNNTSTVSPLEFKGRSRALHFTSKQFQKWRAQATNIEARTNKNRIVPMKAWMLAFNYACVETKGCRESSALLVEDPWCHDTGEENSLDVEVPLHESVIREHLSRQCRNLGWSMLGEHVVLGQALRSATQSPKLYRLKDPKAHGRRYIGRWATWGLGGELIPAISSGLGSRICGDIEILIRAHDYNTGYVEATIYRRNCAPWRLQIHGASPPSRFSWENWIRELIERDTQSAFFVGQDADMLKTCLRTPLEKRLAGPSFREALSISRGDGVVDVEKRPESPHGSISLLENGSLIASADLVEPDEESQERTEHYWTD